jgi:hypothetical protein
MASVLPRVSPGFAPIVPVPTADLANDIETCLARYEAASPGKSFAAANGWSFLINDTNDFLRWQFGLKRWDQAQLEAALHLLERRRLRVAEMGAQFIKFIVPEKSAVYAHCLPGLLGYAPLYDVRPANLLHRACECPAIHLFDRLHDLAHLGPTYLRGDSHPNWQGAYIIYLAIHEAISAMLPLSPPLAQHEMVAAATTYGGDLFGQLPANATEGLPETIRLMRPPGRAESLIEYRIDPARRRASPGVPPQDYVDWFDTRETLVWNHSDRSLPRCVVFRDSTAARVLDCLAEHFSRTVAVWWHGVVVEDVIEREKPDIVIQIQAERFLQLLPTTRPTVRMADMRAAFARNAELRQQATARSTGAASNAEQTPPAEPTSSPAAHSGGGQEQE